MHSNEFSSPSVKQVVWGVYDRKPVSQWHWESMVSKACKLANIASTVASTDMRPRIKDRNSGARILIDTGAAISVWPKDKCGSSTLDATSALRAVNGTTISTFGVQTMPIRFNTKIYNHNFVIADVSIPIIGWDFLMKFKLDVMWINKQCVLFDGSSKSSFPLHLGKIDTNILSLSPIPFHQWSQQQKAPPKPSSIPSPYQYWGC